MHIQIIVVTYFIGAGSGVHLFFFPIAAWLGLFSSSSRTGVVLAFGLAAFLFLLCHFLFPAETTPLAVPEPALPVMFAGGAVGAMISAASSRTGTGARSTARRPRSRVPTRSWPDSPAWTR